jgi:3-hydroxyisobutyrate dehydrogenase-like beta-hydroxyacid dehydrogenase
VKIGFIGLGQMGRGMAANILKGGHEVQVFNRTPGKAGDLTRLGAQEVLTISALRANDVIVTMLANDEAVESVVFDAGGLLECLPKKVVHISCSTISVSLSKRLATAHEGAGQHYLSAPVFGRPEAAAAAKLFVMVGGDALVIRSSTPLLDCIGQKTFVISEHPEAANLVKLSGNFLIAAVIEALGEAIALIGRGGVEPGKYVELLTSTIFNVPVYKIYGNLIVEGKFEPPGFTALLGQKDILLALAAADALGVPMPLAKQIRERFRVLLQNGGEALDWSAIGQLPAQEAKDLDAPIPHLHTGG